MLPGAVVPIAETTRSGVVESVHHGAVVALDADGMSAWSAGDPDIDVYPRSALKPLQAEAMVDAGLTAEPDELAVAGASHDGEPDHLAVVPAILAGAGLDETPSTTRRRCRSRRPWLLTCCAPAGGRRRCCRTAAASTPRCWRRASPTAGRSPATSTPTTPCRSVIDAYIAEAAGGVSHTGVDGCGAPTAMVTLVGLAARRAVVGDPTNCGARGDEPEPDLVGGTGREDTALMRAVPGLLAKDGAEGVHVAAHPDGRAVAVKVADGAERARVPVMLAALRSLGFDVDDVPVPPILGHGRPVGEVRSLVGDPGLTVPIWAACGPLLDLGGVRSGFPTFVPPSSLVRRRGPPDAVELRGPALEVRLHALLKVGPSEALDHQPLGLCAGLAEPAMEVEVHLPLDHGDRRRRAVLGEIDEVLADGRQQLVRLGGPVDQPDAVGLSGRDLARREQQIEGVGRADESRELPGDAPLGDQPALGERRRDDRSRAHPTQIAGQRHRHAHSGDRAVDRRDHRLGHRHRVGVRAPQVGTSVGVSRRDDVGVDDLGGRLLA